MSFFKKGNLSTGLGINGANIIKHFAQVSRKFLPCRNKLASMLMVDNIALALNL
jgi:hypothetical protein